MEPSMKAKETFNLCCVFSKLLLKVFIYFTHTVRIFPKEILAVFKMYVFPPKGYAYTSDN